jgi:mRNA interferase HigB
VPPVETACPSEFPAIMRLIPKREHAYTEPMRLITRKTLKEFWNRHPDAEQPLKAWFKFAQKADWKTPAEVKADYRNASILEDNRACFNIAGNKYRLVVKINYPHRIVYIRFVGPHAEYDKIDVTQV